VSIIGTTLINDDNEHIVALRFLSSTNQWSIWVDGEQENEASHQVTEPSGAKFKVGAAIASVNAQAFSDMSCHQFSTDQTLFEELLGGSAMNRKCFRY
jgi:hypothetical protein